MNCRHVIDTMNRKLKSDYISGYINKYFASIVCLILAVYPVYANKHGLSERDPSGIAKYYIFTTTIMEGLSNA